MFYWNALGHVAKACWSDKWSVLLYCTCGTIIVTFSCRFMFCHCQVSDFFCFCFLIDQWCPIRNQYEISTYLKYLQPTACILSANNIHCVLQDMSALAGQITGVLPTGLSSQLTTQLAKQMKPLNIPPVKEYRCEDCGKRCSTLSNLKKHGELFCPLC